jgi:hypothetical protein
MDHNIDSGGTSDRVSRRWLLRRTANLTAGLVAVGRIEVAAEETTTPPTETMIEPDHDTVTGEIFDRDRHHHWDTV